MKEMSRFSVFKNSYSQSPYSVLHLDPKSISNWSFNNELYTYCHSNTNKLILVLKQYICY